MFGNSVNVTYLVIFCRLLTHGDWLWHCLCSLHGYRTTTFPRTFSPIFPPVFTSCSSPRCRCQSVRVFLLKVLLSPAGPEICSAGRFTQHNALAARSALWWNETVRYPGSSSTGGYHCFNQLDGIHPALCLKFLSLKPHHWVWPWHDWLVPPSQSPAL